MTYKPIRSQNCACLSLDRITQSALLALVCGACSITPAFCAVQERLTPPPVAETAQEAAQAISGSPWPGIIDHQLQRPLPDEKRGNVSIFLNYPSLGVPAIDRDIRQWTEEIANAFEGYLDPGMDVPGLPEIEIGCFLDDNDLNSDYALRLMPHEEIYELMGNYSVSRPSDAAVSITYEIWNYTPDNQSNLDILTLNYNLLNGRRLGFVDIFESPRTALELMSKMTREVLRARLGSAVREQMLLDGTEPLIENFSSLTLTPAGVCVNFQPWQVAPWEAGIQKVELTLEDLAGAGPLLALWGRPYPS